MLNQIQVRGHSIPELSTSQALLEEPIQVSSAGLGCYHELTWADCLHYICKAILRTETEIRKRVIPKISNVREVIALCETFLIAKAYWNIPEAAFDPDSSVVFPDPSIAGHRSMLWINAYEALVCALHASKEAFLQEIHFMSEEGPLLLAESLVIAEIHADRIGLSTEIDSGESGHFTVIQQVASIIRAHYLASQLHFHLPEIFSKDLYKLINPTPKAGQGKKGKP